MTDIMHHHEVRRPDPVLQQESLDFVAQALRRNDSLGPLRLAQSRVKSTNNFVDNTLVGVEVEREAGVAS